MEDSLKDHLVIHQKTSTVSFLFVVVFFVRSATNKFRKSESHENEVRRGTKRHLKEVLELKEKQKGEPDEKRLRRDDKEKKKSRESFDIGGQTTPRGRMGTRSRRTWSMIFTADGDNWSKYTAPIKKTPPTNFDILPPRVFKGIRYILAIHPGLMSSLPKEINHVRTL